MTSSMFHLILLSLLVRYSVAYTLLMNCTSEGLTGTNCINYMRNYLQTYVFDNRTYNPQSLPVVNPYWHEMPPPPGTDTDHVSVDCTVTFNHLISVDIVEGTMSASVFLDMYWTDDLISWDSKWTDGVDFMDISSHLLWMPDVQLYNVVGSFSNQMAKPAVFLSSNGNVWWSGKGMITFACSYDTTDFPFDQQRCSARFASWIYAEYQMDIRNVTVTVDDDFKILAWDVSEVTGNREVSRQWDVYDFSFAVYTITIDRYGTHYVYTAILPSLVVTYITLLALWINEVTSRLALAVTGLLTIIAVQWTISDELPVSGSTTWLGRFSNLCMVFVALVCAECYVAGYMVTKKQERNVPKWVRCLIQLSVLHRVFLFGTRPQNENVEGINSSNIEIPNLRTNSSRDAAPKEGEEPSPLHNNEKTDTSSDSYTLPLSAHSSFSPPTIDENTITWERGRRALDRICRIVFPVTYTITLFSLFAELFFN